MDPPNRLLDGLVSRLNAALDDKNFVEAKEVCEEFGRHDLTVQANAQALLKAAEGDFLVEVTPYFDEACQNEEVDKAAAMLALWKDKGLEVSKYEAKLNCVEERVSFQICESLPAVSELLAIQGDVDVPRIDLTWTPVLSRPSDCYRVSRIPASGYESCNDTKRLVYEGRESWTCDSDPPLGVPVRYCVVSCHNGRENVRTAVLSKPMICLLSPKDFRVLAAEGLGDCGCTVLEWDVPAYDKLLSPSVVLRRQHDGVGREMDVTESSGRYVDEDVVVGEKYRYELVLTVSGRQLDPVVREVTIRELPELPVVEASCYYQEGRHWLRVEWPEVVSEICLTDGRGRSVHYTKEDYDKRRVAIPQTFAEADLEVQAIRRFGPTKMAFGPKRKVRFTDSRSTLQVSIEHGPGGAFSFFKWRQNVSWGLKIDFGGGILPQVMQVSVENEGEKRVFTIPGKQIKQNEFMPFPAHWGVKSGAIIDVFPSDGSSVTYLTSQKIP